MFFHITPRNYYKNRLKKTPKSDQKFHWDRFMNDSKQSEE